MKQNYIINEKWLNLKYKIFNNNFILDFEFSLYKQSLYWKNISINLFFKIDSLLKTSINFIWDSNYSDYYEYKNEFVVDWYTKRLVIDLKKNGIDIVNSWYIDFDIYLKLIIDDSLFFDTTFDKETDIKKIGTNNYLIS
jgi:hypothetical protein